VISPVISDGFGDDPVRQDLTLLEIEEYIRAREGLVRLKVADRLRGADNATDVYADLCNEARIVEWEVLAKRPGAPPEYVSAAMSMRIRECVTRGTWTGMATAQGKPRDPIRRPLRERSSVDDPDLDVVVSSGDWAERIAMAYHHGEIMQALNDLPRLHREYVYHRFWEGRSNPEIAAERGLSPGEVERQWRVNIRPVLLAKLAYLSAP
jgi:hypothetical protein